MKLYNHQNNAIQRAIENNGCLAIYHDPGLGKTLTTLSIFNRYKQFKSDIKLIVICPLSLVDAAWRGDAARFFPGFRFGDIKKIKDYREYDIFCINYESSVLKRYLATIKHLQRSFDTILCLDESSRLKNNRSITTKTILSIAKGSERRLILSGTPCPNSEVELWAQMEFIKPDIFGGNFYRFRNTFFHLQRGTQIRSGQILSRREMQEIFRSGWKYAITQENKRILMDMIRPHVDWVKKEEALDLPEKIEQIRSVELSPEERKAYKEMENFLITEICGVDIPAQVALTKMIKLRQITSGFAYSESGAVPLKTQSKFKELTTVLEELGDRQVIIWCQYHYEIETIAKQLGDKAICLYGETKNKNESIESFKSGKQYLIAHPKSAGHGLTFTNCSIEIFFSLDYSSEAHDQAKDRIHRIGQIQKCLYIYLLAKNTIDETILRILQKKSDAQTEVYNFLNMRKEINERKTA